MAMTCNLGTLTPPPPHPPGPGAPVLPMGKQLKGELIRI